MGMDLVNSKEKYFRWNIFFWGYVLRLGTMFGWEGSGTHLELEGDDKWDGNYWTNDGQWVTADDAFALADALERALSEIPSDASKQADQTVHLSRENQAKDALLKRFVGDEDYLQEFISFCREGGFNIY
jgi:hypothetical protein